MTAALSFVEAARAHARLQPDDLAILDGDLRWSWSELDRRADALVAGLEAAGIVPGDRVGLLATSSAGVVAALHGMVRAGVAVVPIGPRLTRPEMATIAAAARLRAVVASSGAQPGIDGVAGLDLESLLDSGPPRSRRLAAPARTPGTPAVIVPTSGTTGLPKLVRLGAGQLDASAAAWSAVLPPATGWLLSLTVAHVSGIGIVVPTNDEPIDSGLRAARSAGISVSHLSLVVPQLVRLLDASGADALPEEVRAILLGGGPIPESLVSRALAA